MGVLVQYEDLKMCAYNMYLPAVLLNSNTGKIKKKHYTIITNADANTWHKSKLLTTLISRS